jgi:hypothetical protein
MFPGGAAGLALIVLRACVVVSLWMTASIRESSLSAGWSIVGLSLLSVLIAAGAFTPAVCIVTLAVELWFVWPRHAGYPYHMILAPLLAVVLTLLGPGAFSVDAKIFGRRRIIAGGQ